MGSTTELVLKTKVVFKVNNFTKIIEIGWTSLCLCNELVIGSDRWQLQVPINTVEDQLVFGINLKLVNSGDEMVEIQCMATILDVNDNSLEEHYSKRKTLYVEDNYKLIDITRFSTLTDQMDLYLPSNTLTIAIKITVFKTNVGPKRKRLFEPNFNTKNFNDCRLVVKGNEFYFSRATLSDRSQVFQQMFANELSEVIINDIDANVFEEFLKYLYYGDSDKLDDWAEQLLYVADKYMVDDLKEICSNLVYLQINPRNALHILQVMDRYRREDIKNKCLQYIKENIADCVGHEIKWPKSIANNSGLITQLISTLKDNPESEMWNESLWSYTYLVQ